MRPVAVADPSRSARRGVGLFWAVSAALLLASAVGWRFNSAVAAPFGSRPGAAEVLAAPLQRSSNDKLPERLDPEERTAIEVFRRNSPSVVNITNLGVQRDRFSMDLTEIPQGTGSGFLWDDQGHVVTNFHVIQGAEALRVAFDSGQVFEAQVVGYSADHDLAVLRLRHAPTEGMRGLALGSSKDLLVGQSVYAIGNPFGLDQTLTTGRSEERRVGKEC